MKAFFKDVFGRMKKRKSQIKKPEKQKSIVKKDTSRRTAFLVWFMITGLVFLSFLGVMLSLYTQSSMNDWNEHFEANASEDEAEEMNIIRTDRYLRDFVREYINVENDPESLEQRKAALQNYMVINKNAGEQETYDETGNGNMEGTRELKNQQLFHVEEKENETIFQYEVTYSSVANNNNERQTLLLNIPVVTENDRFAVAREPYFTQVDYLQGNIEVEEEGENLNAYTGAKQEEIQVFLDDFFTEYASGNTDDLAYMMEEPETLQGAFTFEEIIDLQMEQREEGFIVHAQVRLLDDVTQLPYEIDVEMLITDQQNHYYVEQLDYQ
ncbi:conjugal transfer protein [Virgibacillus sp. NKC19-16]|uniref:conjugal transfer protein n=1 Tax=Virgibacillus salidurans TaxID=2831673 RepID=UPI001F3517B7|nr:conjugal transfer protein [Virgibacillus sp. NKC19-16]UJL46822.1 conjugal transfer protein [Virgibacillus sp. NKC19-16]